MNQQTACRNWLGIDIGGANCKLADLSGRADSWPFALWLDPEGFASRLSQAITSWPTQEVATGGASQAWGLAITMTGELADCFRTRREGVSRIVGWVEQIAEGKPTVYWGTDGVWHDASSAKLNWEKIAAANWHATASWLSREDGLSQERCSSKEESSSLLVDVGSTTCDLIPFDHQQVLAKGMTDLGRLAHGELVYTGMRRTPVAAVVRALHFRNQRVPVAAERFATTLDAHLLLGNLADATSDLETADGRPATQEFAWDRLARMIGEDRDGVSRSEAIDLAEQIAERQATLIGRAITRVVSAQSSKVEQVWLTGEGGSFVRRIIQQRLPRAKLMDLASLKGNAIARCAPAFAAAQLALSDASRRHAP